MKTGVNLLSFVLTTLATPACTGSYVFSDEALAVCKLSISRKFEVSINESISDGEMDYKEHGEFKFGTINKKQAFVQHAGDDPTKLEDIPFKDMDHRGLTLRSDALAVERSDLFSRDEKQRKVYCLLVPFSGLGSSGSFQQFSALIAVGVRDGRAAKPVGEIVKRLSGAPDRPRQAPTGKSP